MNRKKNVFILTNFILILVFVVCMVGVFVYQSGILKEDPAVEVKADNVYQDTLYVISDIDYMPYSFYSANNVLSGHDIELINMIANELNMNLDLKLMYWDDAIQAISRGEADVLLTCDYSDSFEGVDVLLKTEPVSTDEFIIYSKEKIGSVDELYSKTIAVMKNGNVLPQVRMLNLQKNCIEYKDNRTAMVALESGFADCVAVRYTVGEALLKELGYKDIQSTISIGESYMCFGVSSQNQELTEKLNGAIENLKVNGEVGRLQKKWLTSFIHRYTFAEFVANNVLLIVAIAFLIVCILVLFVRNSEKKMQAENEKNQYIQIIENLANDFECVNYVEICPDKAQDEAALIRISDELKNIIPEWSTERKFAQRLKILCDDVVAPDERDRFNEMTRRETILENLRDEGAYFVNFKAIMDGEIKYYQLKFSAVGDDPDNIKAFVCGLHNVDDETRREIAANAILQNALVKEKELQKELEAANKSKTDFLFNMSHDIRTPMNAITGFTDLAAKHIDDREKVSDYLAKINNSSHHLLELINEVLDMSRVEAGKLTSELKIVNVREEAEKMITICRETADAREIKLSLITDDIQHENVIVDELHVNRIVTNILGNAIKYTMPGGNVVYTVSELQSDNPGYGKYELVIEDNGIGMSEEFLATIFDSFSREENETVHEIQGTGLGMSIVKKLVDFLDGTIDIESAKGKGTKVTVTFYFMLADASAEQEAAVNIDVDLSGKKALLVEDNDLNREIATEILEEHGIIVEEAVNGKEAVSAVRNKGVDYYDFVLMDIQMPFMNGYEATQAIRKLPGSDKLIIIALSANAFEEDRMKSLEAGMNDHIAKPINVKALFGAIGRSLS